MEYCIWINSQVLIYHKANLSMASSVLLITFLPIFLPFPSVTVLAEMWHVDCGAAAGFTNNTTGITWIGDGDYVRGGESYRVSVDASATQLQTLRAFPKNKKNCYTIPVGANTKIRVRVAFHYGNYDGLSKSPSFQLLLDGNRWSTIHTKTNRTVEEYGIYVTSRNHTNICLWRLNDDEVPFVSSIQVWTLVPRMYSKVDSNVSLWGPRRYALGADEAAIIRSPDDSFDRLWYSSSKWITLSKHRFLQNEATSTVNTSTSADDPPAKLFRNAIVANSRMQNLTITMSFVDRTREAYINMYFSEMSILNATEKRAFHVYMYDGDDGKDDRLISPHFGSASEFSCIIPEATKTTRLTLLATADSTLPPIISGFESLYTWKFSSRGTDNTDVLSLSWLQGNFTILRNWTGDPCLPVGYNWEWVRCNSDNAPRIIKLYLGRFGLSGDIPNFSALDALKTIDLQHNNLSGSIPEFLGNFSKLEVLNLAYNNFSRIPPMLKEKTTTKILLNVTGNPELCEEGRICVNSPHPVEAPPPKAPPSGIAAMAPLIPHLLIISAITLMTSL